MAELSAVTKAAIPATTGNVLSLAHAAGMQSSFPLLQKNYKFSKVLFFGRIMGKAQDYLVAIGIEDSWLGQKKFFFCQDGVSWAQLPTPTAEEKANCAKLPSNQLLTGDPSFQIAVPSEPAADEEEEPEKVMIDEVLRLAVIVETIDSEAAMAPIGALSMGPTGAVLGNPAFTGIDKTTAMSASGYVFIHKTKPKDALASAAKKSLDFLVSCDELVPKGALCCGFDDASSVVTVRNLVWPGFLAYTMPGVAYWGYCYFGTGEKNADIAFML
mmetsp:Transcript_49949/g.124200  ORF Transcript_49949/g.124200 Transcript_49949/m.124200 type:complete len:271 (+) Transcript_49949:26-838(+)